MLNPRRVLTRAQLLEHVWDYDFGGDARVLETYVSYLRKKLDAHGPPLIHTVRGVGYALRRRERDAPRCARGWSASAARARPPSGCSCSAAITYAEQRSFLLDRVDQQAAGRARPRSRARSAEQGDPAQPTAAARDDPGRPRPAPDFGLPPGTYGERRDAAATVIGSRRVPLGTATGTTVRPELPREPAAGPHRHRRRRRRRWHALPRAAPSATRAVGGTLTSSPCRCARSTRRCTGCCSSRRS